MFLLSQHASHFMRNYRAGLITPKDIPESLQEQAENIHLREFPYAFKFLGAGFLIVQKKDTSVYDFVEDFIAVLLGIKEARGITSNIGVVVDFTRLPSLKELEENYNYLGERIASELKGADGYLDRMIPVIRGNFFLRTLLTVRAIVIAVRKVFTEVDDLYIATDVDQGIEHMIAFDENKFRFRQKQTSEDVT